LLNCLRNKITLLFSLDPILPQCVYERLLTQLLEQAQAIREQEFPSTSGDESLGNFEILRDKMSVEAENHFLSALLAWGTSKVLKEHIKLFDHQSKFDTSVTHLLQNTKDSLTRREQQSAAGYLIFGASDDEPTSGHNTVENRNDFASLNQSDTRDSNDSLFSVTQMIDIVSSKISHIKTVESDPLLQDIQEENKDSRVVLDAMAKLCLMNDRYDDALKYYLEIAARHSTMSIGELEHMAVAIVNNEVLVDRVNKAKPNYSYLLHFIEEHHLYQNLLDKNFLQDSSILPPIVALMRLVGLDLMGDFLIEHCVPPQCKTPNMSPYQQALDINVKEKIGERRGTLPLDLVSDQIVGNPKLLHWYLHLVFVRKPEAYVKFPNTANPPQEITKLHKKQLDLYIKFAGKNRDSVRALERTESYHVTEKSTPLLSFLKVRSYRLIPMYITLISAFVIH
jgi:hypothetical protein